MDKDAIREIERMTGPIIHKDPNGNEYIVKKDGAYKQIREEYDQQEILALSSLDAFIKMIKTEALGQQLGTLYINIAKPDYVYCFMAPEPEFFMKRPELYEVAAKDMFKDINGASMGFEQALIALKTRFQPTDDLADVVNQLSSGITFNTRRAYTDDGVSNNVSMETDNYTTLNPRSVVELKPYRTFLEVDQPISEFFFRIDEKGVRLIEADGGVWRLAARNNIAAFLSEPLADAIEEGRVVIL